MQPLTPVTLVHPAYPLWPALHCMQLLGPTFASLSVCSFPLLFSLSLTAPSPSVAASLRVDVVDGWLWVESLRDGWWARGARRVLHVKGVSRRSSPSLCALCSDAVDRCRRRRWPPLPSPVLPYGLPSPLSRSRGARLARDPFVFLLFPISVSPSLIFGRSHCGWRGGR